MFNPLISFTYFSGMKNITNLKKYLSYTFLSILLLVCTTTKAQVVATGNVTNVHCHGDSTGSIAYQINGGPGPIHYIWNTGDSGISVGGCTYIVHINNPGAAVTGFQVRVPLNHATGMNANFSNVQFTDTLNNVLPFWLQDFPTATSAVFWVRIPSLPPGVTNIYLTFCSTTPVAGDPNGTFEFFDNFDNNTFPLWTSACISSMAGTSCTTSADNTTYFSSGYSAHLHGGSTCFTPPYSGAGSSISRTINPIVNDSLVVDYEDKSAATLYGFCSGGTSSTNSVLDNNVSLGNGQGQGQGGSCNTTTSGWAAETSSPFSVTTGATLLTLKEYGGDCDNSDGWFDDVRIRKYRAHPPVATVDTTPQLFLNHLAAGTYIITMTAANSTVSYDTFVVTQPTAVQPVVDSTNINCYGSPSGSAWVLPAIGGTPGYTYHWTNTTQTTDTITNLAAGYYQLTVTDHYGCTGTAAVNVIQPAASLSLTLDSVNIACFGQTTGQAGVIASGGTPGYTYLWSDAAAQTTDTISNLGIGHYIVTVTDASHCAVTASVNITQPASALSIATDSINVLCFGAATGQASVTATGGTPGYTYLWNNTGTTDTIKNITAAVYTVTVKDTLGCTATATVNVTQPSSAVTVAIAETDITCQGLVNGTAHATASGGTPGYGYLWNNGQTTSSLTGLDVGADTITVNDANGCTASAITHIASPIDSITIHSSTRPAACGLPNGSITLTPTGGTGTYNYAWSNNATTASVSSLAANTFFVTVTDNGGCTSIASISVSATPAVSATITTQDDSCARQIGTVSIDVTSGTAPYTYVYTPAITDTAKLDSGTYTIVITDSFGCTATQTFTINNISDNCQSLVVFPTAFTPNGDSKNDTFSVLYTPDLDKLQLRIYDRWGQLMYETSDPTQGWTGFFKGAAQPAGEYIWFAEYNFKNKATQAKTGNVMLFR